MKGDFFLSSCVPLSESKASEEEEEELEAELACAWECYQWQVG